MENNKNATLYCIYTIELRGILKLPDQTKYRPDQINFSDRLGSFDCKEEDNEGEKLACSISPKGVLGLAILDHKTNVRMPLLFCPSHGRPASTIFENVHGVILLAASENL
ncbi:hypothetical protein AgCh_011335 [Apium graveolens]